MTTQPTPRKRGRPPKMRAVPAGPMSHPNQRPSQTPSQSQSQTNPLPPSIAISAPGEAEQELPPLPPDKPPQHAPRAPRAMGGADGRIHSMLMEVYGGVGLMVGFVNQYDGAVIMAQAKNAADAWLKLAKQYKELYNTLDFLSTHNAALMMFTVHAGMVLPIAANHGLVPQSVIARLSGETPNPPQPSPPPQPVPPTPNPPQPRPFEVPEGVVVQNGPLAGFTPEQVAEIQRQAAERAAAVAGLGGQGVTRLETNPAGMANASYNPADIAQRPTHNPAFLASLSERRE